ncbi:MAG: RsmB/NOP family class I SAM-dependent RNA methyltransferase [Burkholderiales bacterium]|nr:RsmB/NOP family class I SAM-dependent RNA methyltransferase [Burkholderiales bacterium]
MRFSRLVFEAACEASALALGLEHPADALLSAYFREHPALGRQDRATVAETLYAVLRHKRLLEHLAATRSVRELVLTAWTVLLGANLRELAAVATPAEQRALAGKHRAASETLPIGLACELPDWIIERLLERHDEAAVRAIAAGLLKSAPLDLRVNLLKTGREQALARLAADGIAGEATPFSPAGIRIRGKPAIDRHPLFGEGALEVQDEGSQLICYLLGAGRGQMVADFCAGAGGKTLALGMLMRSTGRLYAFDVSERRLARLKPRLARSGLSNVHPQRIDSEKDVRLSRLAGKFQRVLVDAPCSGLGTLRRNPDLKWRQSPQSVLELVAKQRSILASAARLVGARGRLVYATCSILEEENSGVVQAFLEDHPEFRLEDATAALNARLPAKMALEAGPCLRLWPHRHGTDGFFAAVLTRI